MTRLLILADDLTGAADTGAFFAQSGLDARISLSPERFPDCDVLVLTSESRHLPPQEAFERVRTLSARARQAGKLDGWVYKKIDSTLRGSPAEELAALMQSTGLRRAFVCPAFPAQGRLTRSGCQHAPGIAPIELRGLFERAGLAVRLGLPTDAASDGIWIADAGSDADLQQILTRGRESGVRLLCGSAGLARPLADLLAVGVGPARLERPAARKVLIAAGSRSPVTARQVEFACRQGFPLVSGSSGSPSDEAAVARLQAALSAHDCAILSTTRLPHAPGQEMLLARMLALTAARLVQAGCVDALILTGGDVAAAVCAALEATAIRLGGEIRLGIPWSRLEGGLAPNLPIVTKAGAFGAEDALFASVPFLIS